MFSEYELRSVHYAVTAANFISSLNSPQKLCLVLSGERRTVIFASVLKLIYDRSQLETGIIEKFRNAWRLRRFHRSEETNLSIKPIINTLEKAERQNIRFDFMFI